MSICAECYTKPTIESVKSNQNMYLCIPSKQSSRTIIKNIKKIFNSSSFWTQQSESLFTKSENVYTKFPNNLFSNNITISPEIRKYNKEHFINNTHFDKLLNDILDGIISLLKNYEKSTNININVETVKDIEFPEWEEFKITLKILPNNTTNFEEYYKLWDKIVDKVTDLIHLSAIKDKNILERYGDPLVVFDMCD
jgi:hypothetical protein